MRRPISYFASAIAIAATLTIAPAVQAQDDTAAADAEGLDEIVVTAQRRSENLQDVPLSIDVVSGDKLSAINSGGGDIRALAGRVPSLNIESSFGRTFPRFYIRGLGNTDFDLNASQPVSLVYDDVVLENPILKGFPVFDVERVEVLRGPQGTLFGRNTPAGIVKFDSATPEKKGGYLKVGYGRFNSFNSEGAATIDMGDQFAVRVSGLYQRRDDWVDNIDTPDDKDLEGYRDFALRVQFLATPTENLSWRLSGQFRDYNGSARVFRANLFATGSNDLVGLGGATTDFDRFVTRADGINFQRLKTYNATNNIEWDLGAVTLTSVSSYWGGRYASRGDIDGGFGNQFAPSQGPGFIPFSAQTEDRVPSLRQLTQELRIASNNDGGLGYQAGFFYFDEKLRIETLDYGSPQDVSADAIALQDQRSKAWALFGSVNYKTENGLTLQAGARYNDDKRDFVASRPVDTRPGFLGFGGPVANQFSKVDSQVLTWDVSALYPVNDDVNLFARVARGYRAPSIQGRLAFGRSNSVAREEKTMSYEAGVKSEFGGIARLNLTGYYSDTEDLQLTAVGGASNFTTLLNADKVTGYGVEAEFELRPAAGLEFTVGASYNKNEIKDPNAFVAGCASACTVLDPQRTGSPGIFSINGNQLPQSPKFSANWTAGYSAPVGGGELYAYTDWAYRSKIQFFLYESTEFSSDNLLEGGLRLGYRTDAFDIAAYVRNITDAEEAVGGIDFNNLTGFVNEPRIWGVEAGFKF
ncbi:TonB-dependent receptor [Sphingorhabdus arenilitoris]|uniref:TonB-dependent receptor n=1 Tax=Sphingorhabdus arenilitoris TaxID=1490041 RepID=A0ABV8RHA3_9SPHN